MKLRKLLAGITAAALAVSAMAFSSLSVSAADEYVSVEITATGHSDVTAAIFTSAEIDCKVADEAVTGEYWKQCNKTEEDAPTVYADAFNGNIFKFDANKSMSSVNITLVMWDNDLQKNIGYNAAIDLSKATDNTLKAELTPKGDVASEKTNNWYYLQEVEISYTNSSVTPQEPETSEVVEVAATAKVFAQAGAPNYDWSDGGDNEITIKKDGETVDIKWEKIGNDTVKEVSTEGVQISWTEDWESFVGQNIHVEITDILVGEDSKDDIIKDCALAANWNNTGVEVMIPLGLTTDDLGKSLSLTLKVSGELKKVTPSTGGDDDKDEDNGDNTTAAAPTVSGNKHQGIGMPPVVINQKSAPAASTGAAAASGSASVTLSNSTVVSKDAIDSVAGKDAEFKLSNGASWEIAAADVAKAEGMDLGITLNTTAATADQLKEVAKDNDTFQFSLTFSGDFGFSAVINIPVDAKNNGKYANLYWFNNGKFEFIGSSKVEGGIADFTMKHASDYVIVFDDEAYGEDVSSGAGVYEAESETSAPAAVVVTFAALAVSAVILKKRVF